jgi:membrane protein DedA with SNARE-associated domain/membrane-associated phospholipid phosphatase
MGQWLVAAFEQYGYWVVVVGIFVESLGVPVPGETVLLLGGFFAHQGSLGIGWVIALACAAAVAGDNTGYWIGRRRGRGWVERRGRLVGLNAERLAAIEGFFARHGTKTLLFARFLAGVRMLTALFAGISRIPWRRFAPFEAAGALLWSVSVGLLGYFFGESWHLVERWIGRAGLFLVGLAAAGVLLRLALRHADRLWPAGDAGRPFGLTWRQLWLIAAKLAAVGILARTAYLVDKRPASGFDRAADSALHALAGTAWDGAMRVFDALGSLPAVLVVALLAAAWCLRRRDRLALWTLLGVLLLAVALSADLNIAFRAVRPWDWTGVAGLLGASFPSRHALTAAAVYGMVAFLAARGGGPRAWLAPALAFIVVLACGCASVYLDEAWATDVIAGYAAGAIVLLLGIYTLDGLEARRRGAAGTSPS